MQDIQEQNMQGQDKMQITDLHSAGVQSDDAPRKLPLWAILLAVAAFVIFNAMFLVFAMQMSGGNPG